MHRLYSNQLQIHTHNKYICISSSDSNIYIHVCVCVCVCVYTCWKRSVFVPIPKKGNAKECSNYCKIELISHATKVMLKILQARLQQYMNHELPDVQAGFEKAEEPEIKFPTSAGSWKKRVPEKHLFLLY